jgi:hypothetical protein
LSSKGIWELSCEPEFVFFAGLPDVASLVLAWHLVEDDPSVFCQKWSRIIEYISDICGCPRNYDIVLSLVIWTLREILRSILDGPDICESEMFDKVIHGFDFFTY